MKGIALFQTLPSQETIFENFDLPPQNMFRYWSQYKEGAVACVAEWQMSRSTRMFLHWKLKLQYYIDIAGLVS